jgi:coenzyme F420-reducing hydrogenase alpha subunit
MLTYLLEDLKRYSDTLEEKMHKYFLQVTKDVPDSYFKNKTVTLRNAKVSTINCYSYLNHEQITKLEQYVEDYLEEQENLNKLRWYLTRIFNLADCLKTAKECIPEHLHKYLTVIDFNGDKDVISLRDQALYDALEEAPLKNTILGL